MHAERTDAACCGASPCTEAVQRSGTSAGNGCCPRSRVTGLGAPVSVLIRPSACEVPLLRAGLEAEIVEHERTRPQLSDRTRSEWDAQRDAWKEMRAGLAASGESAYELVWPTAYAYRVLFGALREAAARVAPPDSPAGTASLAAALDTAQACLSTWLAFVAVDGGGLQQVCL